MKDKLALYIDLKCEGNTSIYVVNVSKTLLQRETLERPYVVIYFSEQKVPLFHLHLKKSLKRAPSNINSTYCFDHDYAFCYKYVFFGGRVYHFGRPLCINVVKCQIKRQRSNAIGTNPRSIHQNSFSFFHICDFEISLFFCDSKKQLHEI